MLSVYCSSYTYLLSFPLHHYLSCPSPPQNFKNATFFLIKSLRLCPVQIPQIIPPTMPSVLGDFLQEKQEPFSLEAYLVERGCKKSLCLHEKSHFLKRFVINKRNFAGANGSNFVRAVFRQLAVVKVHQKTKNSRAEYGATSGQDKFFSARKGDDSNSFTECEVGNGSCSEENAHVFLEDEADADKDMKWREVEEEEEEEEEEDNKQQLSPVSVLQLAESDEVYPLHCKQGNFKKAAALLKSSPCELKTKTYYSIGGESQERANLCSQYVINKKVLKETRKLFIDCAREVIENLRKGGDDDKKILGAEELWRLVSDKVWVWSRDSMDESNLIQNLQCDFLASMEEWDGDFEVKKRRIWMEVGDCILEDVINEIAT